jgi:hypothetical protein
MLSATKRYGILKCGALFPRQKILQSDNRLLELSHKPFPSSHAIYFDPHLIRGQHNLIFVMIHKHPRSRPTGSIT